MLLSVFVFLYVRLLFEVLVPSCSRWCYFCVCLFLFCRALFLVRVFLCVCRLSCVFAVLLFRAVALCALLSYSGFFRCCRFFWCVCVLLLSFMCVMSLSIVCGLCFVFVCFIFCGVFLLSWLLVCFLLRVWLFFDA